MPKGTAPKKSKQEKLDRKGTSRAEHTVRAANVRAERVKDAKRDIRASGGRRRSTGG